MAVLTPRLEEVPTLIMLLYRNDPMPPALCDVPVLTEYYLDPQRQAARSHTGGHAVASENASRSVSPLTNGVPWYDLHSRPSQMQTQPAPSVPRDVLANSTDAGDQKKQCESATTNTVNAFPAPVSDGQEGHRQGKLATAPKSLSENQRAAESRAGEPRQTRSKSTPVGPEEVSTQEAADLLGESKDTVIGRIKCGELRARNAAGPNSTRPRYLILKEDVIRLRNAYVTATPPDKLRHQPQVPRFKARGAKQPKHIKLKA